MHQHLLQQDLGGAVVFPAQHHAQARHAEGHAIVIGRQVNQRIVRYRDEVAPVQRLAQLLQRGRADGLLQQARFLQLDQRAEVVIDAPGVVVHADGHIGDVAIVAQQLRQFRIILGGVEQDMTQARRYFTGQEFVVALEGRVTVDDDGFLFRDQLLEEVIELPIGVVLHDAVHRRGGQRRHIIGIRRRSVCRRSSTNEQQGRQRDRRQLQIHMHSPIQGKRLTHVMRIPKPSKACCVQFTN